MDMMQVEHLLKQIERADIQGGASVPQLKNRDLHYLCCLALVQLRTVECPRESPKTLTPVTGKYLYELTLTNHEEYTIECDGYSSQDNTIVFFLTQEGIGDTTVAFFPLHSIEKLVRTKYLNNNIKLTLPRMV